jgi:glutamate 5-kinase
VPTVVVKLGSSVIATDSGELRQSVVARICEEVAALHRAGTDVIIVTSGAIARGIHLLELPSRPSQIAELQAASAVGQGRLYRTYDELLREGGLRTAQVLLTFFDMSHRAHYLNARRTLQTLLRWRIVPVINENDTTTTDEISFGDNDFLAAQVSLLVGADLLILLTDAQGLYTADPALDPAAQLVPLVDDLDALDDLQIGMSASPLGSGGMRSKVVAAEMATAGGIAAIIASGFEPGVVTRSAAGDAVGTRFEPKRVRHSSFKLWLRYAKPSHGTLTIDAGASRALRDGGTSLLPVGVTAAQGAFEAGDAVTIHADDGKLIGKGICNYSAPELRQVMGMKSAEVRAILPRATDEAVHRDYFVLA